MFTVFSGAVCAVVTRENVPTPRAFQPIMSRGTKLGERRRARQDSFLAARTQQPEPAE
jgi:hypothetical protein